MKKEKTLRRKENKTMMFWANKRHGRMDWLLIIMMMKIRLEKKWKNQCSRRAYIRWFSSLIVLIIHGILNLMFNMFMLWWMFMMKTALTNNDGLVFHGSIRFDSNCMSHEVLKQSIRWCGLFCWFNSG